MTSLDRIVGRTVDTFRIVFVVAALIAVIGTAASGNWIALLALAPILAIVYYGGLWVAGIILAMTIPPALVRDDVQSRLIAELNEKLDSGELDPESEEFAAKMEAAGLQPMHIVGELGPIFGRQHDTDFHEWIEAKQGRDGKMIRYTFVGWAEFDEDGTVLIENIDPGKLYVVVEGILYEHVLETPEGSVAPTINLV